jgi:predicted small secreted protein
MMARLRPLTMLLAGALLLAACATEAGFRKGLDQLIGQPKDQLVVRYGPPIYESRTEDGRRYAQFNLSYVETGGGYINSVPRTEVVRGIYRDDDGDKHRYKETRTVYDDQYVPPYAIERRCLTTFYFNAANRVASYAYAGEGCVAPE